MAISGSKILTYSGYKNIEDVSIDDALLKCNGTFEKQKKCYSFVKTSLIHLTTYSHPSPISVVPEQLFYVRQKKRIWNIKYKSFDYVFEKPFWIKANDLTMSHYIGMIINTASISIPEFETYDWFAIGRNFSHYSILQEWLQNAPVHFVKKFIEGFDNNAPMTTHLALGLQRLYLKVGILSKIVRDSNNRCTVLRNADASFIEDGYAWYSLKNIKKTNDMHIGIYTFKDTFIIQNIIVNCP
jgi:hypothetical protein